MESTLTSALIAPSEEMAIATSAAQISAAPTDGVPYLFSAEQFHRMVEAKVFRRECRVELWDGMVYEKMAKNRPHSIAAGKCIPAFFPLLPRGWHLAIEDSADVGPGRVPLPDVMIVRGNHDDFRDRNPAARDVGLILELSDSSLRFDLGPKLAGYARAGIPHYWVANLVEDVIQTYRDPIPAEARFAIAEVFARGETIPFVLDGVELGRIAVDDVLPLPRA